MNVYEHQRALDMRTPFHCRQVSHPLPRLLLASWAFKQVDPAKWVIPDACYTSTWFDGLYRSLSIWAAWNQCVGPISGRSFFYCLQVCVPDPLLNKHCHGKSTNLTNELCVDLSHCPNIEKILDTFWYWPIAMRNHTVQQVKHLTAIFRSKPWNYQRKPE